MPFRPDLDGGYIFYPSESEIATARNRIEKQVYLRNLSDESEAARKFVLQYYLKAHYGPAKNRPQAQAILRDIVLQYENRRLENERRRREAKARIDNLNMWAAAEQQFRRDLLMLKPKKSRSQSVSRSVPQSVSRSVPRSVSRKTRKR